MIEVDSEYLAALEAVVEEAVEFIASDGTSMKSYARLYEAVDSYLADYEIEEE